jgi:diaminohydroxyphosphoribosylaminopyrimidine deaminase/5-amino-6-(5-phosphoribosylamino)uracil reductase
VVLDSQARIPLSSQIVQSSQKAPVLVVASESAPHHQVITLRNAGVEVLQLAGEVGSPDRPSLRQLLVELGRRKMTHVLIEGGAGVLGAAFDAGMVNECHVYIAPRIIGGQAALSPIGGQGVECMKEARSLCNLQISSLGDNTYLHGDWPSIRSSIHRGES